MKDQLKSVDYEALPSNPNVPRWCNLVMWERQNMKAEGLLRDDSPRGIWAISETGRPIPQSVLHELKRERQRRLRLAVPDNLSQTEYRNRIEKILFAQWDKYLDGGLGDCWLKHPTIAKIVQTSLYFFAGERFRLWAYVIMPNHVHVLLEPKAEWVQRLEAELEEFCDDTHNVRGILSPLMKSLKGYTGKEANRILNRRGSFWQRETYNHWVRDESEFRRIVYYIEKNPEKAGLVSQPQDWVYSSAHDRMKYNLADIFTPLDELQPQFKEGTPPDL